MGTSAVFCVDSDMPADDYWIQRWTALVRKVLRRRAPTRRTLGRKQRDAQTRAAISADVARFLEEAASPGAVSSSPGASQPRTTSSGAPVDVHMSLAHGPPHPDADNAAALREIAAAVIRTRGDIERDRQHSEGAALHAAVLAGKKALAEGKSKEEVAAVIESAGADVCGLEQWRCSGSILIAEAHVIGTRGQRFGTPQDQADLE